jgi:hypothetical protein
MEALLKGCKFKSAEEEQEDMLAVLQKVLGKGL